MVCDTGARITYRHGAPVSRIAMVRPQRTCSQEVPLALAVHLPHDEVSPYARVWRTRIRFPWHLYRMFPGIQQI